MKWFGIGGSWRKTNQEIDKKVRNIVCEIMTRKDGIVSGGALGIDFIVLDEALKADPRAERIKVFLPTTLKVYNGHYLKHALLKTITNEQARGLIDQLASLKKINPKVLVENLNTDFTEKTKKQMYYERNTKIVNASDELIAFQIRSKQSEGLGTADTIKKAKTKNIPVQLFRYDLT